MCLPLKLLALFHKLDFSIPLLRQKNQFQHLLLSTDATILFLMLLAIWQKMTFSLKIEFQFRQYFWCIASLTFSGLSVLRDNFMMFEKAQTLEDIFLSNLRRIFSQILIELVCICTFSSVSNQFQHLLLSMMTDATILFFFS